MRPDPSSFPVEKETAYGTLLPYNAQISDSVIGTSDGELIGFIRLGGCATEHLGAGALAQLFARRNQLLISDIRDNIAFHFLTIKRRNSALGPKPRTTNPLFAHLLATVNNDIERANFIIEHYIAVIQTSPISKKISFLDWLTQFPGNLRLGDNSKASRARHQVADDKRLKFEKYLNALAAKWTDINAAVLTSKPLPGNSTQEYSEPLTLLSYLVNHQHTTRPVSTFTTDLNHRLPTQRLSFYRSGQGTIGDTWFASKSIKDFPRQFRNGVFDALLFVDCEIILSLSFRYLNPRDASAGVQKQLRVMNMVDDKAYSQRATLHDATEGIETGEFSFGQTSFHMLYFAETREQLSQHSDYFNAMFDSALIAPTDDDIAIENKYLATLPGNWNQRTRTYTGLHSGNIANMITWRNMPQGAPSNVWTADTGEPLAWLKTLAGTPYNLNLHEQDLGNTIVTGKSGSGKTVLLTYLAACCANAGARIVFIDKDNGAEIFVRAAGGLYYTIEPGTPTGFNPFAQTLSPTNTAFTTELVKTMVNDLGTLITPDELQHLDDAIKTIFSPQIDKSQRRLSAILHMISRQSQGTLHAALKPWIAGGQHGWLFDNDKTIALKSQPIIGYDITHILDQPRLAGLALRWILHQIDSLMDGTPMAIIIDEGWRALDDPDFAAYIRNYAKTIRKRNGLIIFGSNNPADLHQSHAGRELIAQSPTRIFTPNDAGEPEHYAHYNLLPEQIETILAMDMHSRQAVLTQTNHTANLKFDLAQHPGIIKILSSRTSTVEEMHSLIAEHGPDPAAWLPYFHPQLTQIHRP